MPFTLSHAALVLPFSRPLARWRLLSATVIGSMVPDFGLLTPWRPARVETHSAVALLTFCLPVGLAAFWIFQRLIKTPLLEVLPDSAYLRCRSGAAPAEFGDLLQWLSAAAGVLLGAFTHLVWDGFTHEGARGMRMIPALDDSAVDIAGHHLMGFRMMQDVSSLFGLLVVLLIVAYQLRPGGKPPGLERILPMGERLAWIAGYAVATCAIGAGLLLSRHSPESLRHSLAGSLQIVAIDFLRGLFFALLGVSLVLGARLKRATGR